MAHERLRPSFQFDEERLQQLRHIAPEAFADGKINWETLRDALGEYLEEDNPDTEHFGLFWPGKRQARRLAALPSTGTLVPVYGEGLKTDGTPDSDGQNDSRNIFIEGENLEVLKLLQKSYAGRIKMIYIDPPYNTGNDFIYDDDFTEPLQEYLRRTGQVDEEGKALTTNKRADGRFHSKWLSMMYPRLRLARNLLREDGVIFVSIDDNEVSHLRMLMNEVFGEENFIVELIWANKEGGGGSDSALFRVKHEYILCFSRDKNLAQVSGVEISNLDRYTSKDEFFDQRGPYYLQKLNQASIQYSNKLDFPIDAPDGGKILPNQGDKRACWRWSKQKVEWGMENKFIEFKKDKVGNWQVYSKKYLNVDNSNKPLERTNRPLGIIENFSSTQASKNLEKLLGPKVFSYSKPYELIKYLIGLVCSEDDIVLDFFAGSGTTGQAIFELSIESASKISFILVQLQEIIAKDNQAYVSGFRSISQITIERLKKSCSIYSTKQYSNLGFRVLNLSSSHFKPWQNYHGQDSSEVEDLFSQFEDPLQEGWTEAGLTTETLLTEGFPLDSRIKIDTAYGANRVRRVSSDFHGYSLLICLDEKIQSDTIANLDLGSNDVFICLDRAITDQEKLRLSDKGLLKTI